MFLKPWSTLQAELARERILGGPGTKAVAVGGQQMSQAEGVLGVVVWRGCRWMSTLRSDRSMPTTRSKGGLGAILQSPLV